MRRLLDGFPAQCREAWDMRVPRLGSGGLRAVCYAGMGGSAAGGEILRRLPGSSPLPFWVHRDYGLPAWAGRGTLVAAVSHSGATAETLDAYREAVRRGCAVFAVSSGGPLLAAARRDGVPAVKIAAEGPPRARLGDLFFPAYRMLGAAGVCGGAVDAAFFRALRRARDAGAREDGAAAGVAGRLRGRLALIVAAEPLLPAAERWKNQFAENAKTMACVAAVPEMNHNEICARRFPRWARGRLAAVCLASADYPARTRARMAATARVLREAGADVIDVAATGRTLLERMFHLVVLGDWASWWLAAMERVDPEPIPEISRLKELLTPKGA